MSNGQVILPNGVDPNNHFLIIVADPQTNPDLFTSNQTIGRAAFQKDTSPSRLFLKKVKMTPLWKGALLAHESVHVYQWLTKLEQSRPDGFLQGEVDAYQLDFRLLDRTVGGKFKEVLQAMTQTVESNKFRGVLGENDWAAINYAFGKPNDEVEDGMRGAAYIVALNFAVTDTRATTPEEANTLKKEYLDAVLRGVIPVIG